jgi:hypothetical protein
MGGCCSRKCQHVWPDKRRDYGDPVEGILTKTVQNVSLSCPKDRDSLLTDNSLTQRTFLVADDIMGTHPIGTCRRFVFYILVGNFALWPGFI